MRSRPTPSPPMQNILTVCTGNICRSPLAEYALKRALPDRNIASAGVGAMVGWHATDEAQDVGRRNGLEMRDHIAQQLGLRHIQNFDVLLTAEAGHVQWIHANYPESRGRVFLLNHWGSKQDIQDPYRRPMEVYESVYAEIEAAVSAWAERLK